MLDPNAKKKKKWGCYRIRDENIQPRWLNYFFRKSLEFSKFWTEYLTVSNRDILFLLAQGFDPRMCSGITALSQAGGLGKRDCIIIDFDEGDNSPSRKHEDLIEANKKTFEQVFPSGKKVHKTVPMLSSEGKRTGSRGVVDAFNGFEDFAGYTDIVVDISAMPRAIFFPLVGSVLYVADTLAKQSSKKLNVHVIVSENARMDSQINDQGIADDASYVHGFTGALGTEAYANYPKVWIPILGEKQSRQLERIYSLVVPDEICPVLPMPSTNPRRTDNLLVEYRELLFDRWNVNPKNFIYVAEQNPFDVYRAIHRATAHYNESPHALGGCQVVISALSSKLLSIGALLSAYELKEYKLGVEVAHVETQGYEIDSGVDLAAEKLKTELFTLWLAGDCYEQ
jgi:hypothetical protein